MGKSALINRLLKRRMCNSAARPGVTRQLQWVTISDSLHLLDSPGILPPRLDSDQAALNLAICNEIGEASYYPSAVAAGLIEQASITTASWW